jgi:hypothetical protein
VIEAEQVLKRRGLPTPLERRRALSRAARQGADVAVIEVMISVRTESLGVEVQQILSPGIVVVTNVGRDPVVGVEDPCVALSAAVP